MFIDQVEVKLLSIPLPEPFALRFGKLFQLPRVFLILRARDGKKELLGVGEASMDFPFSKYDSWDIFHLLSQAPLLGQPIALRDRSLKECWELTSSISCYAAQAAINMALDDLFGKWIERHVSCVYGAKPSSGQILHSIGMDEDLDLVREKIKAVLAKKRVPKLKCDERLERDVLVLRLASEMASASSTPFAVDFNAALAVDQWKDLLLAMKGVRGLEYWQMAEQPTLERLGCDGLIEAARMADGHPSLRLIADESFLDENDALALAAHGMGLNMKIQKLGGIDRADRIERSLHREGLDPVSMVGGTFPTAMGRVYDQIAASVLPSTTLPSDGWQPATDWFGGDKHLILEDFLIDGRGRGLCLSGLGLGVTPNWDNISKWEVPDPKAEYAKIRHGGSGDHLTIEVRGTDEDYGTLYERLTGRSRNWNL